MLTATLLNITIISTFMQIMRKGGSQNVEFDIRVYSVGYDNDLMKGMVNEKNIKFCRHYGNDFSNYSNGGAVRYVPSGA